MDYSNVRYINLPFKSTVWAMALALFAGPLGIAYTNIKISILMLAIFLIALSLNKHLPYLIYIVWVINLYLSIYFVERNNKKLLERI